MSYGDYIPQAYAVRLAWLKNLVSYAIANKVRLGLSDEKLADLQSKINVYEAACEKANDPNAGKADRLDRKEKAGAATATARNFVNRYLRFNEAVTDDDRVKMGLTVYGTAQTPPRMPDTWPVADVRDYGPRRLRVNFHDSASGSRGKPVGMHGCEICYAILPSPPESVDLLLHSEFSTRSPYTFTFDQNMRGQTVYLVLRWENRRGQKGPWSEIYSAVIP